MTLNRRQFFASLFAALVTAPLVAAGVLKAKPPVSVSFDFNDPALALSLEEFHARYLRPAMVDLAEKMNANTDRYLMAVMQGQRLDAYERRFNPARLPA